MKAFVEYGLDFDNNKYGFGRSVEIEYDDGTEIRSKEKVKLKNKRYYARFWFFKTVLGVSKQGFNLRKKTRNNLKIVFGIEGDIL